jgi:WD40 repeat protein
MTMSAEVLDAFGSSLRGELHVLVVDPGLVYQQLHNRLQWEASAQVRERMSTARRRWTPRTWLRTRFPPTESGTLLRTLAVTDAARADSVGAANGVLDCAFSPDGRTVATASGRTVRLWDVRSGVELLSMEGHEDTVWACAFGPDGTRILSAGHDHTLRLWDSTSGLQVGLLAGHSGPVVDCAFSPDGGRAVSASWDNTVRVWDLAPGGETLVLSPSRTPQAEIDAGGDYRRRVDACAFSPDGLSVVSVVGGIVEWDARTGDRTRQLSGSTCCAYTPDGRRLVTVDRAPYAEWPVQVLAQDLADGRALQIPSAVHVGALACSPDGSRLAAACEDRAVRVWDLETGSELTTLTGHSGEVLCCAYSPDGTLLVSGGDDGTLRFWDATRLEPAVPTMRHQDPIWACAFSHDGERLVSGSENLHLPGESGHRYLTVWDAQTGTAVAQHEGEQGGVRACAFSPDDATVASVTKRGPPHLVALWDARTGVAVRTLSHDKILSGCAFSASGREILASSWDATVRVWRVADGSELAPLVGRTKLADWEALHCCAVSPDGGRVVAGGSDGALRLWDFASGSELGVLRGVGDHIQCCAFSPDGRLLLTGAWGGGLTVWDTHTRTVVRDLAGHGDVVRSCAFGPDGRWAVSGSDDGTARVWDLASGRQLATFPVVGAVLAVAAHPLSARFACGGSDGVLYVLDVLGL